VFNRFPTIYSRMIIALALISFLILLGQLLTRGGIAVDISESGDRQLILGPVSFLVGWTGLVMLCYLVFVMISTQAGNNLLKAMPPLAEIKKPLIREFELKNRTMALFCLVETCIIASAAVCLLWAGRRSGYYGIRMTLIVHGLAGAWVLFLALWSANRWFNDTLRLADPAFRWDRPERRKEAWKGPFYVNFRDPRFFVRGRRRRIWTFNFANTGILAAALLILAVTALLIGMIIG